METLSHGNYINLVIVYFVEISIKNSRKYLRLQLLRCKELKIIMMLPIIFIHPNQDTLR